MRVRPTRALWRSRGWNTRQPIRLSPGRHRMTGAAHAILPAWHSASDHEPYCVVVLVATVALCSNHDQERERRMSVKLKLASLAVGAAIALTGGAAQADQIRLMTGPQGGSWIPLGGQLKDIW